MRRSLSIPTTVVILNLAACAHGRMVPSRDAKTVVGASSAAVSTDNGVRFTADADEWRGKPKELPVTPLKVRIVNHSGRSIKLLYQAFVLEGGERGHVYRALPILPLGDASGAGGERAHAESVQPIYASEKFFVAPCYHQAYPSLLPWPNELPRDMALYQRQYGAWEDGLPTREMQRLALPEGVLADGGEVAGFLYFPNVTDSEKRVHLKVEMNEGDSDEPVATVDIPFRIE